MKRDILIIKYNINTALSRWLQAKNCSITHLFNFTIYMVQLPHSIPLWMPNRHNIAIANLFPLASIESGRKSLVFFQNNLYFLARQSHVRTPVLDAYSGNASVLWGVLLLEFVRCIIAFSSYCAFLKYEKFPCTKKVHLFCRLTWKFS